jgi:SAM-dependent methyltransferase
MAGWWESFFDGRWQDVQLSVWTDEDNVAAMDTVARALRLSANATVLDVPCGDGRVAVELAGRGHYVTGVDLNKAFLSAAASRARSRNVRVDWRRHDMRDLPFDGAFDAALNFGGSFGYFEDESDDVRTAAAVHRALRAGGRFLIDVPTAETVFPRFRDRWWFAAGDLFVLSENRYVKETGRNETDWTVVGQDGTFERLHSSIRLYTVRELVSLLTGVGFMTVETFDAADLSPFELGASRLIAVATK